MRIFDRESQRKRPWRATIWISIRPWVSICMIKFFLEATQEPFIILRVWSCPVQLDIIYSFAFVSKTYFRELLLANSLSLHYLFQSVSPFCEGALLEKKVEMDKRGMGVTDYNGMVTKPLGCRPPPISKESSMDRPTFLDKVSSEIWIWLASPNCTRCRNIAVFHCLFRKQPDTKSSKETHQITLESPWQLLGRKEQSLVPFFISQFIWNIHKDGQWWFLNSEINHFHKLCWNQFILHKLFTWCETAVTSSLVNTNCIYTNTTLPALNN